MGYFSSLDTSASALTAQRLRMDIISQNIANANTTKTQNGTPYRRKLAVFEEKSSETPFSDFLDKAAGNGVRVAKIVEDQTPLRRQYAPGNPMPTRMGM